MPHDASSITVLHSSPIIPRVSRRPETVTIELPLEMAMQLRALCGSLYYRDNAVGHINLFPKHPGSIDRTVLGEAFTGAEVYGVGVLLHNALRRQGV